MMTIGWLVGRGLQTLSLTGWALSVLFPIGLFGRGTADTFSYVVAVGVAGLVGASDACWHMGQYICNPQLSLRSLVAFLLSDVAVLIDSLTICWCGVMVIRFQRVASSELAYGMLMNVMSVSVILVLSASLCQLTSWLMKR